MCAVSNLEILLTRQQIADRVKELGAEITRDFAGQSIIFVGVLKGAAIFLSDLARQVDLDSTFDFVGFAPRRIGVSLLLGRYDRAGTDDRLGERACLSKFRGAQLPLGHSR